MEIPIKGGYILLSRKLIESEIFKKPPLYLKVWIYLLSRAQHKEYKSLKRGQLIISIPEIQEACSYYIGYRKCKPTKKQIHDIITWLRNPYERVNERYYEGNSDEQSEEHSEGTAEETMIVTMKVTHGMLVTIDKYSVYQDSKNYERNNEGDTESNDDGNSSDNSEIPTKGTPKEQRRERQGNNINKNVLKNGNLLYIDHFDAFYKAYPRKVGKAPARKAFDKLKVTETMLSDIMTAIERDKASKQWQDRQYIPHPATWLNQRRWEDEQEQPAVNDSVTEMDEGIFKF